MENYKITEHFSYNELVNSSTAKARGIDNNPKEQYLLDNAKCLCEVMEVIRKEWNDSIFVSSCYRCPKLNKAVGGASNSDHLYFCAMDFSARSKSQNGELFRLIELMIKQGKLKNVRQLIWEKKYDSKNPQWLHLSINHNHNSYKNAQILRIV